MEHTIIKIGQSPLSMQAVPLARARGTRPNKNKWIYTYSWKKWFKGVLD